MRMESCELEKVKVNMRAKSLGRNDQKIQIKWNVGRREVFKNWNKSENVEVEKI